ncbi:adenylate/guanylate cyclase domain-containing protein [Oceanicella actignis]|uniref:Adenylate cyclase n=1 Tax=Oceanicella actignis TaxID=1189325 RepID=A0A1M7TTZ7_9RHOB|nr:adenylate/guanylate cyclase domain-containing protein [Oceanicella actignis]SES77925.1 adenylate cyclase [Oceanicella actignis]SHN74195.1 adenylate cyclase [Oceanicella actignis]
MKKRAGEAPFAAAMRREAERRRRIGALARAGALAALAPVVALVSDWPDALWNLGFMAVLAALGGLHVAAARIWSERAWPDFAFAALDIGALALFLATPDPLGGGPAPAALGGGVGLFHLALSWLALSLRPALLLWGGAWAAALWPAAALAAGSGAPLRLLALQAAALAAAAGVLAAAAGASRRMARRQAELERRAADLARYVPPELAARLAERDWPYAQGIERHAAVLFADLVGFTGWAETQSPQEVLRLLREVQAATAEAVFEAGGVLDKFIGDGAMATFGAAADPPGAARAPEAERRRMAARAALACAERIVDRHAALRQGPGAVGRAPLAISVGVHFGPVIVGDVGARQRLELAVLGDSVNVAARLEGLTRAVGCAACASQELMDAAGGAPPRWRLVGPARLAGRRGEEIVWALDPPGAAAARGAR